METLFFIFGDGKDLNPLQMGARAFVIFFVCLVLIRMSGHRSFGMRTPLDNVITILLGAVLSRVIVGASPFLATITACLVIVVLYRFIAWLTLLSHAIGKFVKGEATPIYKDGKLLRENMKACLVTEKDLHEEMRRCANVDSLDQVKEIYMERSGQMGIVKKESELA